MESIPQHYRPLSPTSPSSSSSQLHKSDTSSSARTISTERQELPLHKEHEQHCQWLPTPNSLPNPLQFHGSVPSPTSTDLNLDYAESLVASRAPSASRIGDPIDGTSEAREDSSELEPRHDEPLGGGLPFEIEMDLDPGDLSSHAIDVESIANANPATHSTAATTESPFSSSHRPLRTMRARYASSDSSEASPPSPPSRLTALPSIAPDEAVPSHKRTFSYVSSSTGQTPPALATSAFEPHPAPALVASPPASPRLDANPYFPALELPLPSSSLAVDIALHPLFRSTPLESEPRTTAAHTRARTHSFESQRASAVRASGRRNLLDVARELNEGGEASRSSSLRRRSPVLSNNNAEGNRNDRERGGSKRRRASTLLSGNSQVGSSSSTSTHQGTQSFAPALGRYPSQVQPVDPVLSSPSTAGPHETSESLQFRSRHRVGFALGRGGLSLARTAGTSTSDRISMDVEPVDSNDRRATSPPRSAFSRLPPWWRTSSFSQSASDRSAPPSLSDAPAVGTSTSFLPTPPLAFPTLTSSTSSTSNDNFSNFSSDEYLHSSESSRLHRQSDQILRQAEETLRFRQAVLRNAEETTQQARRLLNEDREDRERERRISRLPDVGGLPEPAELSARPVIGLRIGEGWPATTNATTTDQAHSPAPPTARRRRSSIFSSLSPPSSPDEENQATTGGTSSRTRQFLTSLRSRRPRFSRNGTGAGETSPSLVADQQFGSPPYDEEAEHRAAEELNDLLLERRRISASLEPLPPPPPVDDGEPERTSGLWGETLVRTSRSRLRGPTEGQNERWRRGQAPALLAGTTTPALVTQPITPLEGPSSSRLNSGGGNPPSIDNNANNSAVMSYFSRRDDSPSPQRVHQTLGFRRSTLLDADAAESSGSASARQPIRLPLNSAHTGPAASSSRARLRFDDGDDDELASSIRQWDAPHLPLMLPSGSDGRRMLFPHPANAQGMSDSLEAAEEGGISAMRGDRTDRTSDLNGANAQSSHTNFNPFDDLPLPLTTTATADTTRALPPSDSTANSRHAPASISLADSLSFGGGNSPRTEGSNQTLRRRHNALDGAPFPPLERTSQDSVDAVAERLAQHRVERLASLRRERSFMRNILGGSDEAPTVAGTSNQNQGHGFLWRERTRDSLDLERERRSANSGGGGAPSSPPRSPGFRRRALGDFFRGFGHGGRLISIFDEEYGAFFGRDAVALDSRNYLEDDEFDASYEGLLRLSAQIGDVKPKGVSQEAISQLRTFPYSKWPYIERTATTTPEKLVASTSATTIGGEEKPEFARKNIEKEARCAICLCDYEEDDQISLAICSHGFHSDCLKSWLSSSGSCPVCRRDHTS